MKDKAKPTLSAEEGIAPQAGEVNPLDPKIYDNLESEPIPVPAIQKETKKFNRNLMLVYFSIAGLVIGLASFALRDQLKPYLPAFLFGTDEIATAPVDDETIREMATAIVEESTRLPPSPTLPPPTPSPTPSGEASPVPTETNQEIHVNIMETDMGQCLGLGGYNAELALQAENEQYFMTFTTAPKDKDDVTAGSIIQVIDSAEKTPQKMKCMYGIDNGDGTYTYYFPVTPSVNNAGKVYYTSTIKPLNRLRDYILFDGTVFTLIDEDTKESYNDDFGNDNQGHYFSIIHLDKKQDLDAPSSGKGPTSHINPTDALQQMRSKIRTSYRRSSGQGVF